LLSIITLLFIPFTNITFGKNKQLPLKLNLVLFERFQKQAVELAKQLACNILRDALKTPHRRYEGKSI